MKDPGSPAFKIFGTGFLIRGDVVLTNRHVMLSLKQSRLSDGVPPERCHVAFTARKGVGVVQSFTQFRGFAFVDQQDADLAFVYFEPAQDDVAREARPVELLAALALRVGDPIAVLGYAFGRDLLKRELGKRERIYRFGPVLQQGYISAIAPYDHTEHVHRLLLDVRTIGGMSGSPVFRPEDGVVVGIHDAGREHVTAFAFPLDQRTVAELLKSADEAKAQAAPP